MTGLYSPVVGKLAADPVDTAAVIGVERHASDIMCCGGGSARYKSKHMPFVVKKNITSLLEQ